MQLLTAALSGFFATLLLIFSLAPLALRIDLADSPGGHRTHQGRVPLVGGIAMFCGFMFAVLALQEPILDLRALFAGGALLIIIGVLDDFHELDHNSRFVAQIAAGLLMCLWGGRELTDLGHLVGPTPLELGLFAVPFTVFAVVGVINAVNMQDGVDGLAGGISALVLFVLASLAFAGGHGHDGAVLLLVLAVVLAFLLLNRRWRALRTHVFMGDAGSLFLGFTLAWFLVDLSQGPERAFAPATALWIIALPLMDTVFLLLRRPLAGRSPFAADRRHLHHLLGHLGLSPGQAVALTLLATALFALVGVTAARLGVAEWHMFAAFLALFAAYSLIVEISWRRLDAACNEMSAPLAPVQDSAGSRGL